MTTHSFDQRVRRFTWFAVLSVLVGYLLPVSARATETPRDTTLVLPIVYEQPVDEETQLLFASSLRDGVASHERVEPRSEDVTAPACADDTGCLAELAQSREAAFVVRAQVVIEARNYRFSLELFDGATGSLVARDEQTCDICGLDEAAQLLRDQSARLSKQIDARLDAVTLVRVDAQPAGAVVRLDGQAIGTAPLSHAIEAGKHTITVEAKGHQTMSRTFEVTHGVEETLAFDLQPLAGGTQKITT